VRGKPCKADKKSPVTQATSHSNWMSLVIPQVKAIDRLEIISATQGNQLWLTLALPFSSNRERPWICAQPQWTAPMSFRKSLPCEATWARHLVHGWMGLRMRLGISVCQGTRALSPESTQRISMERATRTTRLRALRERFCVGLIISLRNVSFLRIRRPMLKKTVGGLLRDQTSRIGETTWSIWWR